MDKQKFKNVISEHCDKPIIHQGFVFCTSLAYCAELYGDINMFEGMYYNCEVEYKDEYPDIDLGLSDECSFVTLEEIMSISFKNDWSEFRGIKVELGTWLFLIDLMYVFESKYVTLYTGNNGCKIMFKEDLYLNFWHFDEKESETK